jgi:hypothetical protein
VCLAQQAAADGCRSGLPPGTRPGPYAAVVCTGPERGRSHCYICETADRPMVIVFTRSLSDPLGKLVQELDKGVAKNKAAELRAWVTVLHPDQATLDAKVVAWAQKNAVRNVPVAVFEDIIGPPSYRLSADADVTVLLAVKQRVVANFAFRAGELNDTAVAEIIKTLPKIATDKK